MMSRKFCLVVILCLVCSVAIYADNIAERMYTRDLSEWQYLTIFLTWWYDNYFDYPVIVRICIFVILLSSTSVTCVMLLIAYNKANGYFFQKQYNALHERFYTVLSELFKEKRNLSFQEVQQRLDLKMQDLRKRKRKRYMFALCMLLVNVKNDFYSEAMYNFNNVRMIVVVLGVQDFLEKMLMFGTLTQRKNAIQISQFLMLIMSESILVRLLRSSNKILSKEIRMYYLWLSDSKPFRFFEEESYYYTWCPWDALSIHFLLTARHKAGKEIPSLTPVINNCANLQLQTTLIKEIGYWGNKDDIENIKQYLDNSKPKRCLAAVECLTSAHVSAAEDKLMEIYQFQTEKVKLYILRALVLFNTGRALDFFVKAWNDSKVLSVKLNVLIALQTYGENGRKELKHLRMHVKSDAEQHLFDVIESFKHGKTAFQL